MKNGFIKNNRINDIINIDDEFESIYNKMEFSNENLFVTGKAGTGKTTLLEYFRVNSKKFYNTPSTGISAIKAKGKTIHSFFLISTKNIN